MLDGDCACIYKRVCLLGLQLRWEINNVIMFIRCVLQLLVSSFAYILITSYITCYSKLQTGLVVYLKVDPEVIMTRIKGTDRPLLQTDDPLETLKKLTKERKERYQQADVTVEVTAEWVWKRLPISVLEHYMILLMIIHQHGNRLRPRQRLMDWIG